MINIADLPKDQVFAALYNSAKGRYDDVRGIGCCTVAHARYMLALNGSYVFDTVDDRRLCVDLRGDAFDPRRYDEVNGAGLAGRVIEQLRRTGALGMKAVI